MILLIDLFCGAGGLTTGASQVPGVKVIACVNHDDTAIASHKANHPDVLHLNEDVRNKKVPRILATLVKRELKKHPNAKVIIWASLECTNFSKAKGGLPREADSRTLAECLFMYEEAIGPDAILIENVEEFMAWGPLDQNGKPISRRNGSDYVKWCNRIQNLGYHFDYRILNAADFGAYTSRKRYFGQFVKQGNSIHWPAPTHAKTSYQDAFSSVKKWKPVKDVLHLQDKGQSIFTRKKPLSENTLKRIYAGLVKYVAGGDESYIAQYNGGSFDARVYACCRPLTSVSTNGRHALVSPEFLIKYYGNSKTQSVKEPSGTVTTKDRMAVVWLDKYYRGDHNHQSTEQPCGAMLTVPKESVVQADFLMNPQYQSKGGDTNKPCFTLIARMDKMPPYLVQVEQSKELAIVIAPEDSDTLKKIKLFMAAYGILNIKMRMLNIDELKAIQGFPRNYMLLGTRTQQKKFLGNAVEVNVGRHIIQAVANSLSQSKISAA